MKVRCSRFAVAVAQSVEPRVVVPVVAGSNPVRHPLSLVARLRRMADALDRLNSRLADYSSLEALGFLLAWDQRTVMPPGGTGHRSEHLALLERLAHEKLTDPEIGRLLAELEPREASLDPDSW